MKEKILEYHEKGLRRTEMAYVLNISFSSLSKYICKNVPELKGKVNKNTDKPAKKGVFVLTLKKRYLANWGILCNNRVSTYVEKEALKRFINLYHAREYIKNNPDLPKRLQENGFGVDDIIIKYIQGLKT